MNKLKLNEPDVEQTTPDINLETQFIIASQYPRKKFEKVGDEFIGIPVPTEEDIFKEFEELGYKKRNSQFHFLYLRRFNEDGLIDEEIIINLRDKKYEKKYSFLTLQEHQLLHRLFEIWGWFDE